MDASIIYTFPFWHPWRKRTTVRCSKSTGLKRWRSSPCLSLTKIPKLSRRGRGTKSSLGRWKKKRSLYTKSSLLTSTSLQPLLGSWPRRLATKPTRPSKAELFGSIISLWIRLCPMPFKICPKSSLSPRKRKKTLTRTPALSRWLGSRRNSTTVSSRGRRRRRGRRGWWFLWGPKTTSIFRSSFWSKNTKSITTSPSMSSLSNNTRPSLRWWCHLNLTRQ